MMQPTQDRFTHHAQISLQGGTGALVAMQAGTRVALRVSCKRVWNRCVHCVIAMMSFRDKHCHPYLLSLLGGLASSTASHVCCVV